MTTLLTETSTPPVSLAARRTNRLLAAMGPDAFTGGLPKLETVSLRAGDEIYAAGWSNDYVYFPHSAVISHIHNSEHGESIEIAMIGSEGASGLCGLRHQQAPVFTAIVSFGGTAARIETAELINETRRNPSVQRVLYDYTVAQLSQVTQRVVCESFHLAEKRLCSWLLMLHDRVGGVRIRITHEQISGFIGVNRSSVTMIAKKLKDEGMIGYMRGKLYILDRSALEAAACECYATVRGLTSRSLMTAPIRQSVPYIEPARSNGTYISNGDYSRGDSARFDLLEPRFKR